MNVDTLIANNYLREEDVSRHATSSPQPEEPEEEDSESDLSDGEDLAVSD